MHQSFLLSPYFSTVCLRWLCYSILSVVSYNYIPEKMFILLLCNPWCVQIIGHIMAWMSYWFVCPLHYLIIIIVQICSKALKCTMLVSSILSSACSRLSQFSHLSSMQYIWGCVFFRLPISLVVMVSIYVPRLLIITQSEVPIISHCLWLG